MRIGSKHALQSYAAQRNLSKSSVSQQEGQLKHHLEETRRVLKPEDTQLGFADILQNLLKPTRVSESH